MIGFLLMMAAVYTEPPPPRWTPALVEVWRLEANALAARHRAAGLPRRRLSAIRYPVVPRALPPEPHDHRREIRREIERAEIDRWLIYGGPAPWEPR